MAPRTLEEPHWVFSALRALTEADMQSTRARPAYFRGDDHPFTERPHGGRVITFASSGHGDALAVRVGQLVGDLAGLATALFCGAWRLRQAERRMLLFVGIAKGARFTPGWRCRAAVSSSAVRTARQPGW